MTTPKHRQLIDSLTPGENCRLSSRDKPLSSSKQKWLNHAMGQVRALKEILYDDPIAREALINIGATLILVDGE